MVQSMYKLQVVDYIANTYSFVASLHSQPCICKISPQFSILSESVQLWNVDQILPKNTKVKTLLNIVQ